LQQQNKILLITCIIVYLLYVIGYQNYWYLSIAIWSVSFVNLIKGYSNRIVFKDLLILLVISKMLFAPAYFSTLSNEEIFRVITVAHLPNEEYFQFALPATLFFVFGLIVPLKRNDNHKEEINWSGILKNDERTKKQGVFLFITGILFSAITAFFRIPGEFGFVFHVLSNLLFVGALYLMAYGYKNISSIYIGIIVFFGFISGMAGKFIWPLFIFGMYFLPTLKIRFSFAKKLALIIPFVFFMMILQSVKMQYRNMVWGENYSSFEKFNIYADLISSQLTFSGAELKEPINMLFERLDQGFLTYMAMEYVPSQEPFANGETIIESFFASFVPRFIWKDKPKAGGREMMEKYAGKKLLGSTSMNIGQFGEAYVNFGKIGGVFFLFVWALILNYFFYWFDKRSVMYPAILFWLPLFWTRGINAVGTDFATSFNTIVKTGIIVYFIHLYLKRMK